MGKKELYFSSDIETNGKIPSDYSMLSLGCVALDIDGNEIDTFSVNLKTLIGAKEDPDTMEWWKGFPEAWENCRKDQEEPTVAMTKFVNWVGKVCGDEYVPVMVAMPSGFDFMFLYWYMIKFAGFSPFSFSCIDMKTYAMALKKSQYRNSSKKDWPKRWFSKFPHTHFAIDDAREQGHTFIKMLKENLKLDTMDNGSEKN